MKKRSLYIPEELWKRVRRAAALETAQTGERVSLAEFVRRACRNEVAEVEERVRVNVGDER